MAVCRPSSVVRRPSSVVRRQQLLVNTLEVTFLTRFSSNLVRMFVPMSTGFLSKLGHIGSKTRSQGQIKCKPCEHSRGHSLTRFSSELVRMFVPMSTGFLSKLGHVGSKTRSLGQIKGKPCEHSRGHIFNPILIKLGQNVCLNDI